MRILSLLLILVSFPNFSEASSLPCLPNRGLPWLDGLMPFCERPKLEILKINRTHGTPMGQTQVIIEGTGFVPGVEGEEDLGLFTHVFFGEVPAENTSINSVNMITTETPPAEPGLVDITVVNPDGEEFVLEKAFRYDGPPSISKVCPDKGSVKGGERIYIKGKDFLGKIIDGETPEPAVFIDGLNCDSPRVLTSETLTCVTPPHPEGPVEVTVMNDDQQSASASGLFTYVNEPKE